MISRNQEIKEFKNDFSGVDTKKVGKFDATYGRPTFDMPLGRRSSALPVINHSLAILAWNEGPISRAERDSLFIIRWVQDLLSEQHREQNGLFGHFHVDSSPSDFLIAFTGQDHILLWV